MLYNGLLVICPHGLLRPIKDAADLHGAAGRKENWRACVCVSGADARGCCLLPAGRHPALSSVAGPLLLTPQALGDAGVADLWCWVRATPTPRLRLWRSSPLQLRRRRRQQQQGQQQHNRARRGADLLSRKAKKKGRAAASKDGSDSDSAAGTPVKAAAKRPACEWRGAPSLCEQACAKQAAVAWLGARLLSLARPRKQQPAQVPAALTESPAAPARPLPASPVPAPRIRQRGPPAKKAATGSGAKPKADAGVSRRVSKGEKMG
jgi:hypothetical protein